MLLFLQKHVRMTWLLLLVLCGLSLGCLTAVLIGRGLGTSMPAARENSAATAPVRKKTLADHAVIAQRNIFDSTSPGLGVDLAAERSGPPRVAATRRVELRLVGTVTGGEEDSLALIEADKTLKGYRLGDTIAGGGRLIEIARNIVRIDYGAEGVSILPLYQDNTPRRTPAPDKVDFTGGGAGVRPFGPNRWLVDTSVVEEARANLGEALKSARMEPRLVAGATDGFVITMIRPGSLLNKMGFRKGDVVLQVNGMPLDSPEKALQIFQQLREARSLRVSLERQGAPSVFEYEIN